MSVPPTITQFEFAKKWGCRYLNAGASTVHPNHCWFKYLWWVFTEEDAYSYDAPYTCRPVRKLLCGSEFIKIHSQLLYAGKLHFIYNTRQCRVESSSPFDLEKIKSEQQKLGITLDFAPSFNIDPDPIYWEKFK